MREGFIDLQCNGWMDIDFSASGLTIEDVEKVTRDLANAGTMAYCPTFITADPVVYEKNFRIITRAMKDPEIGSHILGIHLEGPFISPQEGAVGAHPKDFVLDPDLKMFDLFQEWADGNIKILTVAPERPGCEELIRHAASQGVVVSIGHHMASDKEMKQAVQAGARLCTHVGNGIPNEIHRHRNPLWWQLSCDDVLCLFITDGHHLPADFIKVALRAKTPERFLVTSDASPLAGMPPGRYSIFSGLDVIVNSNGLIYSQQTKGLAGSHATMIECMNHLASLGLLGEDELWRVGYDNQARLLDVKPDFNGRRVLFKEGRFVMESQQTEPTPLCS